jgi:hypothetical protein
MHRAGGTRWSVPTSHSSTKASPSSGASTSATCVLQPTVGRTACLLGSLVASKCATEVLPLPGTAFAGQCTYHDTRVLIVCQEKECTCVAHDQDPGSREARVLAAACPAQEASHAMLWERASLRQSACDSGSFWSSQAPFPEVSPPLSRFKVSR